MPPNMALQFDPSTDQPSGISAITALAQRFAREQQSQKGTFKTMPNIRTGECPTPDCETEIEIEVPADYDPEYEYKALCPECTEEYAWILDANDDTKVFFVETEDDEEEDADQDDDDSDQEDDEEEEDEDEEAK